MAVIIWGALGLVALAFAIWIPAAIVGWLSGKLVGWMLEEEQPAKQKSAGKAKTEADD